MANNIEEKSFQKQLNEEVVKRLDEMEKADYPFPERMKKNDWIVAGIIALAVLVIVEVATIGAGGGM